MLPLYIYKHHPHVTVNFFVPDYFKEFAKRCVPVTNRINVVSFTELQSKPGLYNKDIPTYSFDKFITRFNNLATHMVDHAFFFMNVMPIDPADKDYPQINLKGVHVDIELPERYAVMAVGYTSKVREWLPEHINKVADHLVSKGITPVYLGKSSSENGVGHSIKPVFKEEIDLTKGISLIDKLSLVESAKVISRATMLVGLDSGLTHVTGCTTTPLVVGYTSVESKHRLPYRNGGIMGYKCYPVELTKQELSCRACQSNNPFLYEFKFTECHTKTLACLKLLNADKYIKQIDLLLSEQ